MYLHTTYWLVSYNEKTKWYQGCALILQYEILMTSRKKKQSHCKINGYILTTPIFFTCQCHGHTSSVNSAETPPIFDIEPFKNFFQIKMLQYVSISRKNWKIQLNFFFTRQKLLILYEFIFLRQSLTQSARSSNTWDLNPAQRDPHPWL